MTKEQRELIENKVAELSNTANVKIAERDAIVDKKSDEAIVLQNEINNLRFEKQDRELELSNARILEGELENEKLVNKIAENSLNKSKGSKHGIYSNVVENLAKSRNKGTEENPSYKLNNQHDSFSFEIKNALIPMSTEQVLGDPDLVTEKGISQGGNRLTLMEKLFGVVNISAHRQGSYKYKYMVKKNGDIVPLAEQEEYPSIDAEYNTDTVDLKKIGGMVHYDKEVVWDFSEIKQATDRVINTFMSLSKDKQLYDGDGLGKNLLGFKKLIPVFDPSTYTGGKRSDTTAYDLIEAMALVINLKGEDLFHANFAIINPNTYYELTGVRSKEGVPITYPRVTDGGKKIGEITIYPFSLCPENEMQVGCSSFASCLGFGGTIGEIGHRAGEWEKDIQSFKLSDRRAMLIEIPFRDAFIQVGDIKAAIAAITETV